IQLRPNSVQARYQLAQLDFDVGRYAQAAAGYANVLEQSPNPASPLCLDANLMLGVIAMNDERHDDAKRYLLAAEQIDPDDPRVMHNLAVAAVLRGAYSEAV